MKLSIKTKLAATFFLVLAMSGAAIGNVLLDMGRLNQRLERIVSVETQKVVLVQRVNEDQLRLKAAIRDMMLARSQSGRDAAINEVRLARESQTEVFKRLTELTTDEAGTARLKEYETLWNDAKATNDKAIGLTVGGDVDGAQAVITSPEQVARQQKRIELVGQIRDALMAQMDEAKQRSDAQFQASIRTNVLIVVVAGVLGLGLAAWIILSISGGLATAIALTRRVASGDLTSAPEVQRRDEVGDLLTAANEMVVKLRAIVGQVGGASRQVAAGSTEMAATSEQLSQGAAEQASATAEASASVEQMVANIGQTTENAAQTEKIAAKSAADARESGQAVAEAVGQMQEIAGKIMVVQEIARQTDLLALNAAVEAARAGEHGRGFAVVASEVRKLAERSQQAASEISKLSSSTMRAADAAGQMLGRLVPDIEATSRLVSGISVASRELNAGAQQIGAAIEQLDKVTQQNATASEQLSTAAVELSAQAEQMEISIGYFRSDASESAAVPAAGTKPVMSARRSGGRPDLKLVKRGASGGFDLDVSSGDDLDRGFSRNGAA